MGERSAVLCRPTAAAIVLALVLALGGFLGLRWWSSDGHRRHQAMNRLQSVPAVTAVRQDGAERIIQVAVDRDASVADIRRAITGVAQHADDDGLVVVLTLGPVRTRIVHDGRPSADLLAPAMHALASASLPAGAQAEIGPAWDLDVRLARRGKAIGVARAVVRALGRDHAWSSRLEQLRVHGPKSGPGAYDALTVTGGGTTSQVTAALTKLLPLQRLRPDITIGASPHIGLTVSTPGQVRSAYSMARRLMPEGSALDLTIDAGSDHATRISGAADPAPALALIRSMRSAGATVSSVTADGRSVEVSAPSPALTKVVRGLKRAKVEHVALFWVDGSIEKGSVMADAATVRAAVPGLRRLQRAGYRVEWTARDHSHLNDGPTIEVESITDTTTGTPLDEADHGVGVMRALRQLHWHGTAALVFTARDGDARNRPSFLSTAAGTSHATPDPGPSDEIAALRDAWDTSRSAA